MPAPDDLVAFVHDALRLGRSRADIAETLGRAGWTREQTDAALGAFADLDYPLPVPRPKPYLSAKEAFWYLVLFTALYLSAFNLGALLFQFVDLAVPDPTDSVYAVEAAQSTIRWAIAVLAVAFPLFLFMSRLIREAVAHDPAKRASRVRKWLTYLTLFIAVCVLVGDAVSLLFGLLSGALETRFVLKALVVAALAGSVLGYYLRDLRQDEAPDDAAAGRRLDTRLGLTASLVVVMAVVGGIVVAGGPGTARLERLDQERLDDLRRIRHAVQESRTLPGSLDSLVATGRLQPDDLRDPATHEPYGYRVLSASAFEQCATFALPSDALGPRAIDRSVVGPYDAGVRHCFTAQIGP